MRRQIFVLVCFGLIATGVLSGCDKKEPENAMMASPANRVAHIRSLVGASELRSDVASLLTEISASADLSPAPVQLREFAERYTAAWCSQEAASVAAFFAPDGSLSVNYGAPAVGRGAITGVAQGFMTAFPDMVVRMDDLLLHTDRAVYCWTLLGTNTAPGGTGNKVQISGFEVWQIGADGLIVESLGHFDSAAYQHQLEHGGADTK